MRQNSEAWRVRSEEYRQARLKMMADAAEKSREFAKASAEQAAKLRKEFK